MKSVKTDSMGADAQVEAREAGVGGKAQSFWQSGHAWQSLVRAADMLGQEMAKLAHMMVQVAPLWPENGMEWARAHILQIASCDGGEGKVMMPSLMVGLKGWSIEAKSG